MAIEAHQQQQLYVGGHKLATIHASWEGGGSALWGDASTTTHQQQQWYQHRQQSPPRVGMPAAAHPTAGSMIAMGQFGQVCATESAVTQVVAPGKRKRADLEIGGAAGVAAKLQQQLNDVDHLVCQHTTRMWEELAEQRRRHARQVVATVEAAAAKRLRAKDEEIERITRLNWALEERVKSLFVEMQAWRDLAQSNEAATNALRGELRQVLDAQARDGVVAAAVEDTASCCYGENDVADDAGKEEKVGTESVSGRCCKVCGEGAAEVLLLPCRHLCACTTCAVAATACPTCGCANNGSVCVNFS